MKLFAPGTQVVKRDRCVVMHFPDSASADSFMASLAVLEQKPMIVQAGKKMRVREPESVWSLIWESLR